MSFKDIALPLVKRGIPVIPVEPLSKETRLPGGEDRGTTDIKKIMMWHQDNPDYNVGCLGTTDGITVLDCDVKGLAARIEKDCSRKLPQTLIVQSANKGCAHIYFRSTDASRRLGNKRADGLFDLRGSNHYVVGPGSNIKCDDGEIREYKIWRDAPIADFPDWLEPWILQNSGSKKSAATGEIDGDSYARLRRAYLTNLEPADMFGLPDLTIESLHPTLHSLACLLHDGKRSEDDVADILEKIASEYGHREARGRHEIDGIVEHAFKKAPTEFTLPDGHPSLTAYSDGLVVFATEEAYKDHIYAKHQTQQTGTEEGAQFKFPKIPGKVCEYVLMPLQSKFDGWFGRGRVSLVGGSSGAGKTTLICDLLNQQWHRKQYLGHLGAGLRPLIIFADRGELSNAETFDRLGLTDAGLPIAHLPVSWDETAAAKILELVERESPLPEVVFLEGADALVSDAAKTQIVAPFLSRLQAIAAHYHIAFVLSVGAPKAKPKEQHILKRDRIFGSQIWPRMSDTIATLEAVGDGTNDQRDLTIQHRNAGSEKFELEFSNGRLVDRLPAPIEFDPVEAWLLGQPQDQWISRKEIVAAMKEGGSGLSPQSVYRHLDKLQKEERIEQQWAPKEGLRFRVK